MWAVVDQCDEEMTFSRGKFTRLAVLPKNEKIEALQAEFQVCLLAVRQFRGEITVVVWALIPKCVSLSFLFSRWMSVCGVLLSTQKARREGGAMRRDEDRLRGFLRTPSIPGRKKPVGRVMMGWLEERNHCGAIAVAA